MDNPMIGNLFPPNTSTSTLNFTSDDDDHHPTATFSAAASASAKKPSPWHRMKWTDEVVRLLITLVSIVGDDVVPPSAAAAADSGCGGKALQQKKGKWKTVSKLMLEKGCYVSPQQCEDKFNDLNKRYKRLNEILGRGTTCQVVENPSLLDTMHHVPAKAKEDVRKILSSKHLFYREMCAYHNGQRIPNSRELELNANGIEEHEHDHDVHELNDSGDEDEDEDEEEDGGGVGKVASLGVEIDGLSPGQQREWLRKRALQLLEEKVEIEAEGFEYAKQRAKWERFKSKKDWEMERERLENERAMIENERALLQVRRKEMELDSGRERGRVHTCTSSS